MNENAVLDYIKKYNMFGHGDKIGAAVSGGADSTVMLYVLKKLGFDVTALHFEHGIRGEESMRDMRFVRGYCEENSVPFICGRADVPSLREKGESMETAARRLRYEFFEKTAKSQGFKRIATAHHADDNAETVIMNLLRGSGVSGMRGISPVRGIYVRPMLFASRAEIESYALENEVPFVTDSTNLSGEYTRNKIRSSVLPVFREINPSYAGAVLRACELAAAEDDAFKDIAAREFYRISSQLPEGISIDIQELNKMPPGLAGETLKIAISRVCSLKDVEKCHYDAVFALARAGKTGKVFELEGKFTAFVSYNRLIIAEKLYKIVKNGVFELSVPGAARVWEDEIVCSEASRPAFTSAESMTQYFDADKLSGAVIRTRRQGDFFRPLGAAGGKKLKDWFIDKKVPSFLRDAVPVLARGGEVLWVIGFGISESVRVKKSTKRIAELKYLPKKYEDRHGG